MDDGALVLSYSGMVTPVRRKAAVFLIALAVAGALVYFFLSDEKRAVTKGLNEYITAMIERDFDEIYRYHAPSQKKRALSLKTPASEEARQQTLKVLYQDQLSAFEQAESSSTVDYIWSEKFLFIKEMDYQITSVTLVEDIENPSLPIKKRTKALVEISVEYRNEETAPDLGGKVRKAAYLIRMVHSRNVARTWEEKSQEDRWLFKSISVRNGSLAYW